MSIYCFGQREERSAKREAGSGGAGSRDQKAGRVSWRDSCWQTLNFSEGDRFFGADPSHLRQRMGIRTAIGEFSNFATGYHRRPATQVLAARRFRFLTDSNAAERDFWLQNSWV